MDYATLSEVVRENIVAAMTAVSLYLTVVTGFLVIVYFVGAALSKFQVFLVTSLFVVFASFFTLGSFIFFAWAHNVSLQFGNEVGFPAVAIWYSYLITIAETLGILGSLTFLLNERKKGGGI